jgi:hypothetical protein
VLKDELKDARNDCEDACLRRLAEVLPANVRATILADRGFADTKLFEFLGELGFDYVIRLKGNTRVGAVDGTTRPAQEWVGQGGRARKLRDAAVTEAHCPVGAAVCVHAKGMKEPWCLVTGSRDATAPQVIKLYSKRWTVEPSFRDTKDLRFGLGLGAIRIADPQRRCCCSTPSPSSCSPCSVPPARASAWTATSSPTPSRPDPIPCSARAACSTT